MVRYWQWNRVTIHTKTQSNFLTSSLESSLCDYSNGYILVTGNINVVGENKNTKFTFKNLEKAEQK